MNIGLVNADIIGGDFVGSLIGENSSSEVLNFYSLGKIKGKMI